MIDPSDICFVGLGSSAPCYYRCLLPATALGADYAGLSGDPPHAHIVTGMVKGKTQQPRLTDYKIVVLQQARGAGWLAVIEALRERGVIVLYELDDNLHAIESQRDHDFRESFTKDDLAEFEACIRACDGLIVSTPYLENAYRKFNKRRWVCENGIDPARYAYTRPERATVNVGWAGATGHRDAVIPWLKATASVMHQHRETTFISIGQPFAEGFVGQFGRERALSIPWCAIEQYPAAMTMFDIALAPAARTGFYLGKSDLRWLEASALGIPVIGHPAVYRHIVDGVTGFHADHPAKVTQALRRLVGSPDLRTAVGRAAREHVLDDRAFPRAADQWASAFEQAEKVAVRRLRSCTPSTS